MITQADNETPNSTRSPEENYRFLQCDLPNPQRFEMIKYKNLYSLEKYYDSIKDYTFRTVFLEITKTEAGTNLTLSFHPTNTSEHQQAYPNPNTNKPYTSTPNPNQHPNQHLKRPTSFTQRHYSNSPTLRLRQTFLPQHSCFPSYQCLVAFVNTYGKKASEDDQEALKGLEVKIDKVFQEQFFDRGPKPPFFVHLHPFILHPFIPSPFYPFSFPRSFLPPSFLRSTIFLLLIIHKAKEELSSNWQQDLRKTQLWKVRKLKKFWKKKWCP